MHLIYLHNAFINCLKKIYIKRFFIKRNIIISKLFVMITHYASSLYLLFFFFYLRVFIYFYN